MVMESIELLPKMQISSNPGGGLAQLVAIWRMD